MVKHLFQQDQALFVDLSVGENIFCRAENEHIFLP